MTDYEIMSIRLYETPQEINRRTREMTKRGYEIRESFMDTAHERLVIIWEQPEALLCVVAVNESEPDYTCIYGPFRTATAADHWISTRLDRARFSYSVKPIRDLV